MLKNQLLAATFVFLALPLSFAPQPLVLTFPGHLPLPFLLASAALYGDLGSALAAITFPAPGLDYLLSVEHHGFSFFGLVLLRTGLSLLVAALISLMVFMSRDARAPGLRSQSLQHLSVLGERILRFFSPRYVRNPRRQTVDVPDRNRADEDTFRLAAIVDSSDDAIISKDLNGVVTSWNAAAEHLFGYRSDEMIGRSILTIIPSELHDEEPRILASLRAGIKIDHYETERVRKDGTRVYVALTISPVKDFSGKIIGASKIVRDISERKRVQEALVQSEKLAATGRMAAAIAHEVNNPLEAVTNLAYLLSTDQSLSETARTYTKMLLEEIARASEITKQTLAFYRDSGTPSEFDVRDLLDNVIRLNRPGLQKKQIEVVTEYRSSECLVGSASEIRQVIANLLLNAIDAVPEGGKIIARVDVESPTSKHARRLRVTVADNGHGIPLETRKRLFEPFVTTKGARGNGLGLWVSKGIVKKHGGSILVRSSTTPGRSGTVFSVVLPLVKTTPAQGKL